MDLEEIRRKSESFNRTEKALEDERIQHAQKVKKFTADYKDFIRDVHNAGYVWGLSGWKKNEVEC